MINGRTTDIMERLAQRLSAAEWERTQRIIAVAETLGYPLYLVGGVVRDLLLERPFTDLDLVVEGDGITFAHEIQQRFGGTVDEHTRFRTAKWHPLTAADSIDFITARTESYSHPAALPEVEPAPLLVDLGRRDFTINTLALRLDGGQPNQILDRHGGLPDLNTGIIRVLHDQSFIDDPTRIWRAVRYEQRLGFVIEPNTAALLPAAIPYLSHLSPDRVRHELEFVLLEDTRSTIMARLAGLGVLNQIEPGLGWRPETTAAFDTLTHLAAISSWQDGASFVPIVVLYAALWLATGFADKAPAVLHALHVSRHTRETVTGLLELLSAVHAARWTAATPASAVERLLRPFQHRPHVLLAAAAFFGSGTTESRLITRYHQSWRAVRTAVTGYTLRDMGLPPGPRYQELLDKVLAARLDGEVVSEAAEVALLRDLLVRGNGKG